MNAVVKFRFVKLKISILILFCVILAQANAALGQELLEEPIPSNSSGEIHSLFSDMMRVNARQSGERLFVIVRLGDGETSRRVVTARIKAARNYFLRDDSFDAQTAVFAEGERVKGKGRFEYYLGSKLQFVALAPKNAIIHFTCCKDYFPPVKKKTKRKKSKR